ncbi:MAG: 6-phosphogluconolactonase [Chthoniobacterales bacterium]
MKPEIIHTSSFLDSSVALIEKEAKDAIAVHGVFRIALSGGNTPRPVYEALAKKDIDWSKVLFTFGDERCVPPDDKESNYLMAKISLFDRAPIPEGNVLRMRGEIDPEEAAKEYEALLSEHTSDPIYRHDLLLLGMGPDGHTASLFPGTPALEEKKRLVVPNFVPKFNMWRLTFTYPLLDASRHVCFLVNSVGKDEILEEVFSGKSNYPCAAIQPTDGKVTWMLGA